ncbi:MAG: ribonuclease HII [Bacteroidota bacterium]
MRNRQDRSSDRLLMFEREIWDQGVDLITGIDEAGRGPLAGPVVAAAVVFPKGTYIEGVKDSKQLSEKKRESFFGRICQEALSVGIGIIGNETIDAVNIRNATVEAMLNAVENLHIRPQYVLVDGTFFLPKDIPGRNIIRGDEQSFTIGAASIVAKVTRDRLMKDYHLLFPMYNFARHKGYGTREHVEAIRKFGLCSLHRRTFRCSGWVRKP